MKDEKRSVLAQRLSKKEITLPTDLIGAILFFLLGAVLLLLMPGQVPVSRSDVVNGRVFPTMLMALMMLCCGALILQNMIKMRKKQPLHTCTVNLLTEIKALVILGILIGTYLISKWTNLFVAGAIFCSLGFLIYFGCRKKSYYVITVSMAVAIWAIFRFILNVKF